MGKGYNTGQEYPPENTGQNLSRTNVIVLNGNATDSVAGTDLDSFVTAKHDGTFDFPSPLYDTGYISLDLTELKITNARDTPLSLAVSLNGRIVSSSTSNTAVVGVRLNSTGGILTGTDKVYPAGATSGGTTLDVGFTTIGAVTLQPGESLWLDVSKNVTGTLVVQSALTLLRPIY